MVRSHIFKSINEKPVLKFFLFFFIPAFLFIGLMFGKPNSINAQENQYTIASALDVMTISAKEAKRIWFEPNSNVLYIALSKSDADRFGELTRNNVGKHIAVVDNSIWVSSPRINGPILGGTIPVLLGANPKIPHPALESKGHFLFFVLGDLSENFDLDNISEADNKIIVSTDKKDLSKHCDSLDVFLFFDQKLIGAETNCSDTNIVFEKL